MKKEPTKCPNCKETDVELFEVEIAGEKKLMCGECRDGFLLTKEEEFDKLNNNQLANNPPDFTAS